MIELLKPYKIDSPKVRFGEKADGGYVINQVAIDNSSCLFTYGVGGTKVYEVDYVNATGKKAYLFDHTNGWPETDVDNIKFTSQGLGDCPKCKNFKAHYEEFNITGRVLLKIDTEGAEYEYFLDEDYDFLRRVCSGIILEIHTLQDPVRRVMAKKILKDLNKSFILTHIHGNVWGGESGFDGFSVPNVMELSFVNRDYVGNRFERDLGEYPTELDYSNNPNMADLKILFNRF